MKVTKELIINLILQDLKHNQLILGLDNIALGSDEHHLNISDIVAQMMGLVVEDLSDQWCSIYFSHLKEAVNYDITSRGENLLPLATKCYEMLVVCSEVEGRSA